MCTVIYEEGTLELAKAVASGLENVTLVSMDEVKSNPEALGDFETLGFIAEKEGKGISMIAADIIVNVLGNMDLKPMEYLFAIVQTDKAQHSLKCLERLFAKAGCAPSYLAAIDRSDEKIRSAAKDIAEGNLLISSQSIGTGLWMRRHLKGICR